VIWPRGLVSKAEALLQSCRRRGLTLATAESCTGGLIAALLTEIPGSSDVVERGFVTYSNKAKIDLLGVPRLAIDRVGAVSEVVARAMATGAQRRARVDLAVGVTGVAGPGGGSVAKPVGLVHIACARRGKPTLHVRRIFKGNRAAVRLAAVVVALQLLQRQASRR
jgi:nicotinamide-nucleotide amidase